MNRQFAFASTACILCLAVLSACSFSNRNQSNPSITVNAQTDNPPTSAATTTATHTLTPTNAAVPQQTPSTAAASSTKAGVFNEQAAAWLVTCIRSETESRVVAYNPDGSGRKDLLSVPVHANFCQAAASSKDNGGLLAVVTAPVDTNYYPGQLNLSIIQLPEGRLVQQISLINGEKGKDSQEGFNPMVLDAVGINSGMSWSPDGSTLAFIAAIDGPTADVYFYHAQSGKVTRASEEPDQASGLSWSPDGRYVLYQQVEAFGGGGSTSKAVWAADAKTNTARRLVDTGSASLTFDGWTKDGSLIAHPWGGMLGLPETRGRIGWLQRIDPQQGTVDYLLPPSALPDGSHISVAYNPDDDWISLAIDYPADVKLNKALDGTLSKPVTLGPQQFWAIPTSGGDPKLLFSEVSQKGIGIDIAPAGQPGHWLARFEYSHFDLSFSGRSPVLGEAWFSPDVSSDHSWLAFHVEDTMDAGQQTGLSLVSADGTKKRLITQEPVSGVMWRPDSQGLMFISNEKLFYLPIDQDVPIEMQSGVYPYLFARNLTPSVWVMRPVR